MEFVQPNYSSEAYNNYYSNEFWQIPIETQYANLANAFEYKNKTATLETPLSNELEVLRYCQIVKEQSQVDDNSSIFDTSDEAQKILSGYYINIDESLNIFKEFYDDQSNPFAQCHRESLEYLKTLQSEGPSYVQQFQNSYRPFKSETFDFGSIEKQTENDSDDSETLQIDTGSETSLLDVSDCGIGQTNAPDIVDNAPKDEKAAKKKLNFSEASVKTKKRKHGKTIGLKRKRGRPAKSFSYIQEKQNTKPKDRLSKSYPNPVMSHKRAKKSRKSSKNNINTSTPNKNPEKNFQNLSLSPILPFPVDYRSQKEFTSQEVQLIEEKKYLEYLEAQFSDAVFTENGRTIYPIATNCNFNGISYDFQDELRNNEIMKNDIFCRLWRRT